MTRGHTPEPAHAVPALRRSLLEDGEVDVVLDLEGTGSHGETYIELAQMPLTCAMLPEDQLAKHESLTLSELEGRSIASCRLERVPTRLRNDFLTTLSACPEHMRYVCDSPEAAIVVAATGAAISIQPSNIMPPDLGLVARPLADIDPVGFGAYVMGKGSPLALRLVGLIGERVRADQNLSPFPGRQR